MKSLKFILLTLALLFSSSLFADYHYHLKSLNKKFCMGVDHGKIDNHRNIALFRCSGTRNNQNWF